MAKSSAPTKPRRYGLDAAFPWVTPRFVAWLVAIAFVIGFGALWTPLVYLGSFGLLVLLGFLSVDLASGPRRGDITVTREPIEHLALRSTGALRYAIVNRARMPVRYSLVDTPVDILDMPEDAVQGSVGPDRRKVVELAVTPLERGDTTLGDLYLSADNPLGLVRRRWRIPADTPAHIYPDLSAVERYGMLARRGRLVEAGFRKLRLRGGGGEFDSLREWQPDDEFRSIDWKATARRNKLMVAQYDVERSQTVMLVLDAGRLMTPRIGGQRKFDYAVTAALSVASIASLVDDKVGVLAFAGDIREHIAPRAGSRHVAGLVQRLYDLQPRFEESDYAGAFAYLRRRQPKRSLVVFFTDMFDPVASASVLANVAVLSPRHLVVCVLMNDEAVSRALQAVPETAADAYRASVAATLAAERRKAAALLQQRGIAVIDVPAAQLTVSLINAYIDVKARDLL
ncbi:MAG TPA: DUF58 domain-containing protein [Candidatus Eremiobacteraceae bacterium]|nr:DUF58 domain-containing protein [Candidatus Eremiobacteraceae bacterium]